MTKNTDSDPNSTLDEELETLTHIVAPCFECATCASSCPVFQSDHQRNPRRIIYNIANGNTKGVLDEVDFWWCGGCYSCEAHCPQNVPLTRIFFKLKNLAFHSGKFIPKSIIRTGKTLQTGFLFTINEKILKKRKQLHLPLINKPSVKEISSLLKTIGFYKYLDKTEQSSHE